ncbi:hypothetical protein [Aquitalea magnusonii]|uniref:endonuclease/exonuclease/phosphatase family protein n=1 Tax=Aquitalea magnusonii TaxID=332411 RepID=UPI000B018428
MNPLKVTTYNIHKGMSPLNRHLRVEEIAQALETLSPDLLFLQEVQGKNLLRACVMRAGRCCRSTTTWHGGWTTRWPTG